MRTVGQQACQGVLVGSITCDETDEEITTATDHVTFTRFGPRPNLSFKSFKDAPFLALKTNQGIEIQRPSQKSCVHLSVIALDDPQLFKPPDTPQAGWRGNAGTTGKFHIGHASIGLKFGNDLPVDGIQFNRCGVRRSVHFNPTYMAGGMIRKDGTCVRSLYMRGSDTYRGPIMPEIHHTDLLVVGAGPAGYTAAIYAARASLKPILVTGMQPGGQLTITTDVENYPGFATPVQGPWLMEQMRAQAEHVGTRLIYDLVTQADLKNGPGPDGYFRLIGDSGDEFRARTVVIATGAQAKWLGLESEKRLQRGGVSACATCDGFFYRGKTVAVIGGGNTAVEEALYLTHHANKVHLIHRRDSLRAERILQERLFSNPKIEVHWNRAVEEVLGAGEPEVVCGLKLKDTQTGALSKLDVDGVFVAIGHTPNAGPFRHEVACDEDGYILTESGGTETSVKGVFAAGDIQDRIFRQAVTAAGTGCMAALEAERYLSGIPAMTKT